MTAGNSGSAQSRGSDPGTPPEYRRPAGLPSAFAEAVLDAVAAIPAGTVRSYAQVAAACDSDAARAVGSALRRYGSAVPWWRVVRADGRLAPGHEQEAARLLRDEGVAVSDGPDGLRVAPPHRSQPHTGPSLA